MELFLKIVVPLLLTTAIAYVLYVGTHVYVAKIVIDTFFEHIRTSFTQTSR